MLLLLINLTSNWFIMFTKAKSSKKKEKTFQKKNLFFKKSLYETLLEYCSFPTVVI